MSRISIALVTVVLVLVACTPASGGTATANAARTKACGTYASTSIYKRARVYAIRGVGCSDARSVARRYDHGKGTGRWRCFLAHGSGRRLFSCGYPPRGGDIRKSRHALEVRGVGSPRG